jgi:hypothetical protein
VVCKAVKTDTDGGIMMNRTRRHHDESSPLS